MARYFRPNDSGNSHHNHAQIMPVNRSYREIAETAFKYVDAMLRARKCPIYQQ